MVSEAFKDNKSFEINLGKPTESLKNLLTSEQKIKVGDNTFIIKDKHWLREKDRHGYDHFEGEEWREYNIPLNAGDLDMLPSLWRNPDRVLPGYDQNSILLQIDTLDGGVLTAIVNIKNTPKIKTYFKSKRKLGLG